MQREIKLHFVRSLLSVHLPHKKIKCIELGTFKILQQRTNFREHNFKNARMHVFILNLKTICKFLCIHQNQIQIWKETEEEKYISRHVIHKYCS